MLRVMKRNKEYAQFDIERIKAAIEKAFQATKKEYTDDIISLLALRVTAAFQGKVLGGTIHIEDIQDSVEQVLEQTGYSDVAKAYILYRKNREKMREMKSTILDYREIVNSYLNVEEYRLREGNQDTYSVGGMILSNSGVITANYWLSEIYDDDIREAHRNHRIHIHKLSMLTGDRAAWSLDKLILQGLGGVPGKITSAPAAHLNVLCNQLVNFLGIMQNEWAGAQTLCSFDTALAPFVKADGLSYEEVKNCLESFIFGVNMPSRWGTQSPFSRIILDWTVPENQRSQLAIVGGKCMEFTYGECEEELEMIDGAILELMLKGDAKGKKFPFPHILYTGSTEMPETKNQKLLEKYLKKYKVKNFYDEEPILASIGTVTIFLSEIARQSQDEYDFYKHLDQLTDLAARSLKEKGDILTKLFQEGFYPYTRQYQDKPQNYAATICFSEIGEAAEQACWLKKEMSEAEQKDFENAVAEHMKEHLADYREMYGARYLLEMANPL